jgi:hypothetical protein
LHEGFLVHLHQCLLSRLAGCQSVSAVPFRRQPLSLDLLGYSDPSYVPVPLLLLARTVLISS